MVVARDRSGGGASVGPAAAALVVILAASLATPTAGQNDTVAAAANSPMEFSAPYLAVTPAVALAPSSGSGPLITRWVSTSWHLVAHQRQEKSPSLRTTQTRHSILCPIAWQKNQVAMGSFLSRSGGSFIIRCYQLQTRCKQAFQIVLSSCQWLCESLAPLNSEAVSICLQCDQEPAATAERGTGHPDHGCPGGGGTKRDALVLGELWARAAAAHDRRQQR